jgi:hypothetical protein
MAKYFRLERKEDVEFLIRMFDRAINKIKNNVATFDLDQVETITRIHDSLHNAADTKDAESLGVPESVIDEDTQESAVKKRTSSKPKSPVKLKSNLCTKHPYYGAVRAPQQACDGCWSAYKSMNPNTYAKKLQEFERKMAKKQA